jgi:hypothetical protein
MTTLLHYVATSTPGTYEVRLDGNTHPVIIGTVRQGRHANRSGDWYAFDADGERYGTAVTFATRDAAGRGLAGAYHARKRLNLRSAR